MPIIYHETTKTFHLQNAHLSYVMQVLKNGQLGQLYFVSASTIESISAI